MRTLKNTNTRKFAPHRFIYKRIDDRKYVDSKNIDVYKGVLSVNARKGKGICEFAHQGFIYVHAYLCYDTHTHIYIYICKYVLFYKELQFVQWQGQIHMKIRRN